MAVSPRGSGYQAEFVVKGERYRKQFETHDLAVKWELETRTALKLGKPLPDAPEQQIGGADAGSIGNALRAAKEKRWAYQRGSTRAVLNAEKFVEWVGAKTPAKAALHEDKIHEFVRHLKNDRKVTGSTINRYLSSISVLIKFARVARPELKYQEKGPSRLRYFTEEEVALVIQTLTLWGRLSERDLFIFLIDTGARPYSEGTSSRWSQFRDRTVTFGELQLTKTGKARTIPLTTRALEAVARQKALKGNHEGPWTDITEWQMIELWRNVRGHLPQLSDTVVYTCRHTCASWQVQRGVDLLRVKEWMGHNSYQTTLGYAHLAPKHLMDNLAVLEGGAGPNLRIVS
jgi:integrase